MARNEIKLREQLLTGHIHRHRNYEALMKQHQRTKLFQRTVRFFIYSLIVTLIVLTLITLSYYVIQLKKGQEQHKEKVRTAVSLKSLRLKALQNSSSDVTF